MQITPHLKNISSYETFRIFVHHKIVSAGKRVEFGRDRLSYIVLRCRLCNFIVLNVHVPSEKKSDDSKDGFYDELEQEFLSFSQVPYEIYIRTF